MCIAYKHYTSNLVNTQIQNVPNLKIYFLVDLKEIVDYT